MNTKEAAAIWGVTSETVQRYCRNGRIKHCKKIKGMWILHPLCHKPIDRRYKVPCIRLTSVKWRIDYHTDGSETKTYFRPLLVPKFVYDGLEVTVKIKSPERKAA